MSLFVYLISGLLLGAYCILIVWYRQSWCRMPITSAVGSTSLDPYISVIIPARNESANIVACLNSLAAQTLPANNFEIWVIDDFSTDDTAALVRNCQLPNVHLLLLSDHVRNPINSYKKKAIETGIAASKGDIIVTTDADCIVPPTWLAALLVPFNNPSTQLVAAPVKFSHSSQFVSIFQALDFMSLQGITGAAAAQQLHSMCNGANLAYRKTAFNRVNGFRQIDDLASGDDMLLMHKIKQQYPTGIRFLKSPLAIVTTLPMPSWKSFLNQRIRWASKAAHYTDKSITVVLWLVYLLNAWIVLASVAAVVNFATGSQQLQWASASVGMLVIKTLVELYFMIPVARFFNQDALIKWFPLAQPFHILYTVIAGWLGKFGTYQWKDRTVQ